MRQHLEEKDTKALSEDLSDKEKILGAQKVGFSIYKQINETEMQITAMNIKLNGLFNKAREKLKEKNGPASLLQLAKINALKSLFNDVKLETPQQIQQRIEGETDRDNLNEDERKIFDLIKEIKTLREGPQGEKTNQTIAEKEKS